MGNATMNRHLTALVGFLLAQFVPVVATAAEGSWGGLTAEFQLKGTPPKAATIDPGTDQVCCKANPQDESVVVGKAGELANVVIYLHVGRGEKLKVHPDLEQPTEAVELDNSGCSFKPHVVFVHAGQTLKLKNADATNHNVKAKLGSEAFNFMVPAEGEQTVKLEKEQRLPCAINCSIHPFMQGWVLVRDNPYMAASDKEGKLAIDKLPAGTHEFQFWHERVGYLKEITVGEAKTDRRGRVKLTIPTDGKLELGKIDIDAELMKEKS